MKRSINIRNKIISALLCVLLIFSAAPINVFAVTEYTYGLYKYTVSGSNATIISYDETATGDVVIPSIINGKTVTAIGESAFYGCTVIESVTIPYTTVSIDNYAFSYCISLKKITIPNNVTTIGKNVFQNSKNVKIICCNASTAYSYAKNNSISYETTNIYNLGEETYSFENFEDSDSAGHCFGMSMTSSGYFQNKIDYKKIDCINGKLFDMDLEKKVTNPICYYQSIQGSKAKKAIVAGGSSYLGYDSNISSDWESVINYVKNHNYDDKGLLQIGYRVNGLGGHAINFLRYAVVNGQERIYAYDNNFPNIETYFYKDKRGNVLQGPKSTFGTSSIDCITLRSVSQYYSIVGNYFESVDYLGIWNYLKHVLFSESGLIKVVNASDYLIDTDIDRKEFVVFEVPEDKNIITVLPLVDNAKFTYLDETYSFGDVDSDTVGVLTLSSSEGTSKVDFEIKNEPNNVKSISLSDKEIRYKDSGKIIPTIDADSGASYTVKYSSSNENVATVDQNGNVYGAKRGDAKITCTVTDSNGNTVSDTCKVTVSYAWWQWLIKILLFGWIWY